MPTRPIENIVIFDATGDLAARMLLPSLFFLDADGLLPEGLKIVGSARTEMDGEAYSKRVRETLDARSEPIDAAAWDRFRARLDYCAADVSKDDGLDALPESWAATASTSTIWPCRRPSTAPPAQGSRRRVSPAETAGSSWKSRSAETSPVRG